MCLVTHTIHWPISVTNLSRSLTYLVHCPISVTDLSRSLTYLGNQFSSRTPHKCLVQQQFPVSQSACPAPLSTGPIHQLVYSSTTLTGSWPVIYIQLALASVLCAILCSTFRAVQCSYTNVCDCFTRLLETARKRNQNTRYKFPGFCGWRFSGQMASLSRFFPRAVCVACYSETLEQTSCAV